MTGRSDNIRYNSAKELQTAIDEYFKDCKGSPQIDENGEPALDKNGKEIIVGAHPPTITGLALSLGFRSRQELLNFQANSSEFNDIISVAKLKCEEFAERSLYGKDYYGAKFSLENNFNGWGNGKKNSCKNSEKELPRLYEAIMKGSPEEKNK